MGASLSWDEFDRRQTVMLPNSVSQTRATILSGWYIGLCHVLSSVSEGCI